MKKLFLIFITYLLTSNISFAQNSNAKEIIKTLSSPEFHGRGYVNKGDRKAVKFIQKEFKQIGILPFGKHLQEFSFNVNTQPKSLALFLNNDLLNPGLDYLVNPGSPSLKGVFKTILINKTDLLNTDKLLSKLNKSINKFLLIDNYTFDNSTKKEKEKISEIIKFLKYSPQHPAKGVIEFSNKKLTWHGSTEQNTKVSFEVNKKITLTDIKTVKINLKSKFLKNYKSNNCVGYIKGTSKSDSLIVLTAHYDHLGRMGKETYFPGANDNASGIALLLDIAKKIKSNKTPPKHTTVFIAFGGEELGLLGSKYFTENPSFPLSKIKFLMNFDLAGTGSEGIKVVNGGIYNKEFQLLNQLNKKHSLLPAIKPRGKACNSDHCYFDMLGIKCFYSYTLGGIKAYHDIHDKSDTLPLTEFEDYSSLIHLFINNL
jgi:hypothetical protein